MHSATVPKVRLLHKTVVRLRTVGVDKTYGDLEEAEKVSGIRRAPIGKYLYGTIGRVMPSLYNYLLPSFPVCRCVRRRRFSIH